MTRLLRTAASFATLAGLAVLAALVPTGDAQAQQKFITIGTGGSTGVYYVVGQSVCRLVNRGTGSHGIRCTAPSTGGSIANLAALRVGERQLGVVQSDWQYHAYNGTSRFEEDGPNRDLRAVFSVHMEPFTVLARKDAGIRTFDDLKGKRVNIGNPGSGQRATMEVVMQAKGWTVDDFRLASELQSAEQAKALCDNKVDAIVFTVGHPNGSIQEATTTCETVLVAVDGPEIEKLVADQPYYAATTIPGGMYRGNPDDVRTFGVGATFVSTAKVGEAVVYEVVKAVFENFDRFRKLHPAFETLTEEDMVTKNLSAPLHPGAEKHYRERGWR